jgi:hypothetical protein
MPSEIVVQCFFRLDNDHFNHQILRGWKNFYVGMNSDPLRPFV